MALCCVLRHNENFNPRSPHGERRGCFVGMSLITQFQSTLPARGATVVRLALSQWLAISIHAPRTGSDRSAIRVNSLSSDISIHAPRTGSDWKDAKKLAKNLYFNPRSPHGERRTCADVD